MPTRLGLRPRDEGAALGGGRLVLRGSCRQPCYVEGLRCVLAREKVLLKDFRDWAKGLTERLKAAVPYLITQITSLWSPEEGGPAQARACSGGGVHRGEG